MMRTASWAKLGITAIQLPFFPGAVPRRPASHVPSEVTQIITCVPWILISAKPHGFAGMANFTLLMGGTTSANPQNSRKRNGSLRALRCQQISAQRISIQILALTQIFSVALSLTRRENRSQYPHAQFRGTEAVPRGQEN